LYPRTPIINGRGGREEEEVLGKGRDAGRVGRDGRRNGRKEKGRGGRERERRERDGRGRGGRRGEERRKGDRRRGRENRINLGAPIFLASLRR
jgi:hypothetical protein